MMDSIPSVPSDYEDPIETLTLSTEKIVVHTSYDPASPPSHPGKEKWTRFVCLSDTHSRSFDVPDGDVLLHAGDLTQFGKTQELTITMDWLYSLPHSKKLVVAGNHDFVLDTVWYESNHQIFHRSKEDVGLAQDIMSGPAAVDAGVIYLDYSETTIQAKAGGKYWKIYGSPGSPWFGGWAFNYERGDEAKKICDQIPPDTDILLTHGPPFGILDKVNNGERVGCAELADRLATVRPILSVFGHIHEDRGVEFKEWPLSDSTVKTHTLFVNAANTPSGPRLREIYQRGARPSVGGSGFFPIILDLYDPVEE